MSWEEDLMNAETEAEVARLPDGCAAPSTITARALQQTEFPPVSWVVHDLIPEGVTLLAGKPKLGSPGWRFRQAMQLRALARYSGDLLKMAPFSIAHWKTTTGA